MQLKIQSKENILYQSQNTLGLTLTTPKGITTMLDGHVNFISRVLEGQITIKEKGKEDIIIEADNGTIIIENNKAEVLIAPKVTDDRDFIAEAKQNAIELLEGSSGKEDDYDYARVIGEIQKELLNLRKKGNRI